TDSEAEIIIIETKIIIKIKAIYEIGIIIMTEMTTALKVVINLLYEDPLNRTLLSYYRNVNYFDKTPSTSISTPTNQFFNLQK
ncbi:31376_t:CDS:1, partial [Gigaspora margarita]